jgi:hypothetical protein
MSAEQYTRIEQMKLSELSQLGAWEFAAYYEASSKIKRHMILLALKGK